MNNISFLGCKPEYYTNGIRVIPIEKDPTLAEIAKTIDTTYEKDKFIGEGKFGKVYQVGEDLVVKRYMRKNNGMREIEVLNNLYDSGFNLPRVQKGKYGFVMPDGYCYLVSDRIDGKKPHYILNQFNDENFASLIDLIFEFDKLHYDPEKSSYFTYIHHDLQSGNIKITDDDAGILDLDFLKKEYLHDSENKFVSDDYDYNFSDIPGCVSNLRNFEFLTLYPYYTQLFPFNKSEFFEKYLSLKSQYHKKMSDYLKSEYEKNPNAQELLKLSKSHKAHSDMLYYPDEDVFNVENMKIRLPYSKFFSTIITSGEYLKMLDTVKQRYKNESDPEKKIYWEDCLKVLDKSKRIPLGMRL